MCNGNPTLNISELTKLIYNLTNELSLDIERYQKQQKAPHELENALDTYHTKLSRYISDIDNWYDLPLTPDETKQLNESALYIDEAQHLMTKAIGLIKTS